MFSHIHALQLVLLCSVVFCNPGIGSWVWTRCLEGIRVMVIVLRVGRRGFLLLPYSLRFCLISGSSYPKEWDYGRFRRIADNCGAVLMCDMAHISGLVAAKEVASPLDYCDIAISTAHKNLRGPREGIIFYSSGTKRRKQGMALNHGDNSSYDFGGKINFALYPSLQGAPHNHHIATLAIAFNQVKTPRYKVYMEKAKKNAKALSSALLKRKCRLVTDGTDNYLLLWDLTALRLIDSNYEKVCETCCVTLNNCAIHASISPGGSGTPAMTSKGCSEEDFETTADFLFSAAQITSIIQMDHGKSCKDFLKGLQNNKGVIDLRFRVAPFASQFAMPGFDI